MKALADSHLGGLTQPQIESMINAIDRDHDGQVISLCIYIHNITTGLRKYIRVISYYNFD